MTTTTKTTIAVLAGFAVIAAIGSKAGDVPAPTMQTAAPQVAPAIGKELFKAYPNGIPPELPADLIKPEFVNSFGDQPPEGFAEFVNQQNEAQLEGYKNVSPQAKESIEKLLAKMKEDPQLAAELELGNLDLNTMSEEDFYNRISDPESREMLRTIVQALVPDSPDMPRGQAPTRVR